MTHSDIFYLFFIISLGYILGNIKIKGFSLDISAILIVALIAGNSLQKYPTADFLHIGSCLSYRFSSTYFKGILNGFWKNRVFKSFTV